MSAVEKIDLVKALQVCTLCFNVKDGVIIISDKNTKTLFCAVVDCKNELVEKLENYDRQVAEINEKDVLIAELHHKRSVFAEMEIADLKAENERYRLALVAIDNCRPFDSIRGDEANIALEALKGT